MASSGHQGQRQVLGAHRVELLSLFWPNARGGGTPSGAGGGPCPFSAGEAGVGAGWGRDLAAPQQGAWGSRTAWGALESRCPPPADQQTRCGHRAAVRFRTRRPGTCPSCTFQEHAGSRRGPCPRRIGKSPTGLPQAPPAREPSAVPETHAGPCHGLQAQRGPKPHPRGRGRSGPGEGAGPAGNTRGLVWV